MLGKLAYRNAKRSFRDYLIYLVTVTLSFSLIFAFHLVAESDAVTELSYGMDSFKILLTFVNIVILFVVCFLINYTTKFIFEKRSRELGTYLLLGIRKKELSKIVVLENLILGFFALLLSIPTGLILSQFLSLVIVKILGAPQIVLVAPGLSSIGLLLVHFLAIYILVLPNMLWKIKKMTIHSFLYLDQTNEKKLFRTSRKRNVIFIISLIIGAASLWLWHSRFHIELIVRKETFTFLMLSMTGVILSIYGISATIADMVCSLVLRSKKIKFQKDNLFVARTFASKARTMSFVLGTLSMLVLLSVFSLNMSKLNQGIYQNSLNLDAPYDVSIHDEKDMFQEYINIIDEDYTIDQTFIYDIYMEPVNQVQKFYDNFTLFDSVIKWSDYNHLLELRNQKAKTLTEDEYLILTARTSQHPLENNNSIEQITLSDGTALRLKEITDDGFWYGINGSSHLVLVLPDIHVSALKTSESHLVVDTKEETAASLYDKICDRMSYHLCKNGSDGKKDCQYYRIRVRGIQKEENNTMIAMVSSIFIYISFIFIAVVGTILAIQCLSDAAKYRSRYLTLRKLGVSDEQLYKTIRKQLLILFGIPVIYPVLVCFLFVYSINQVYHVFLENQYVYLFYFAGSLAIFTLIYGVYWIITYIGFKRNMNEES